MRRLPSPLVLIASLLFGPLMSLGSLWLAPASGAGSPVVVATYEGVINPVTAEYLHDALAFAEANRAQLLVVKLDTPGGLVTSMQTMVKSIVNAPLPVAVYVSPSGGRAASAGVFITLAGHVAAMAPGTNLGAATPVEIGTPLPGLPGSEDGSKDSGAGDEKSPTQPAPAKDVMSAKITNDAVALIRSLAELRGRNADWGEKAVREAASLSANAALDAHVIDLVARDMADLLQAIDGRKVEIAGSTRSLATKGLPVETLKPGWLIELLSVITDPNIAVLLMLIGVYGLAFEFMSPGAVAPGVIGTISLLLGLYALNLLPIDYTGLALMLLGIIFLIVEAFNPTVVLGVGGLAAFLLGVAMLFRVDAPGFRLSWTIIGIATAMICGLLLITGRFLWTQRKRPARTGTEAMRGQPAEILDWSGRSGHVLAQGERWQADGEEAFTRGERVEIADVTDLTLTVRRGPNLTQSLGELP